MNTQNLLHPFSNPALAAALYAEAVTQQSNLVYLAKWLHMGEAGAAETTNNTAQEAAFSATGSRGVSGTGAAAISAAPALTQSAMQRMLATQQKISTAALALSDELNKRPLDEVLLTAAAWNLADAAGLKQQLAKKLQATTAHAADTEYKLSAAAFRTRQRAQLINNWRERIKDFKISIQTTKKQAA